MLSLTEQVVSWCAQHNVSIPDTVTLPSPSPMYALPNGKATSDYAEAKEAWFYSSLQKNVVRCNTAGKHKFCAGRL